MDFPARPPERCEVAGLAEALGAAPAETWSSSYVVAVMAGEAAVHALKPDLVALERVSGAHTGSRGNVGVAALADPGKPYEVVSRFFAPGSGIPEDPATGSLHCILAPLFAGKLGRSRVRFHQAYPGRGGDLDCEVKGDRVLLRGQAVTVLDGRLRVSP